MSNLAILTANLGSFDEIKSPIMQDIAFDYHCFTDEDFAPITGLTPRLQYRIPKTHGWQMKPDYEYYIWLDGSVSLLREDCATWYLEQLGDGDIAFFAHPSRNSIVEEVEHIDDHLQKGKPYITSRYKNGLHWEFLERILDEGYEDNVLYASTAFIYKNTPRVQSALIDWWYLGTRYFTCDQVQLPYVLWKYNLDVRILGEPIYKSGYLSLVSKHK